MANAFEPVLRQSLSDDLAQRVDQLIRNERYQPGDRLPAINEMARRFGVGHPTLREALRKLETLGIVEIRHGSGVYVGKGINALLVSNPIIGASVSKKLLVDLIEARMAIEVQSAALAALNATPEHLDGMRQTLTTASENLGDNTVLNSANMTFHRLIALASGNAVMAQLLEVLSNLFQREQRVILDIYGSREKDHAEHLEILDALRRKDATLAADRMRAHLEGVRLVLLRWDPNETPVL
ncbi:MAG TPA: FadR/GntR family transcriptional regulator [Gemmatimonadaceae bacterium]|nr:FadR/GntR family transcriptional regulator [Gemmatimonadaceae bacterium]